MRQATLMKHAFRVICCLDFGQVAVGGGTRRMHCGSWSRVAFAGGENTVIAPLPMLNVAVAERHTATLGMDAGGQVPPIERWRRDDAEGTVIHAPGVFVPKDGLFDGRWSYDSSGLLDGISAGIIATQ